MQTCEKGEIIKKMARIKSTLLSKIIEENEHEAKTKCVDELVHEVDVNVKLVFKFFAKLSYILMGNSHSYMVLLIR